jgi:hypothetical protein
MTSPKRVAANHRNARKSTGPRTAAGKERSRMNALKHGLDAQTLILPGEDDAAFLARLEAWRADVRPRNSLEDALVEQAARFSWQVDRADRVQAVYLTERIRLAGDEEVRRRDGEAADAAAIGQRLTLGGNRMAMPIHPDAPDHPERLLGSLESTAAGCRWLLDRWSGLRESLERNLCWRPEERLVAVRLLARAPVDAVDDPMVLTIYLGCFVLDPDGPQVFADQTAELSAAQFDDFLQRMAGRRVSERVPPDRASARAGLLAMVNGVIDGLELLESVHAERAKTRAASAPGRLAFDDSPAGERLRRLQTRLMNSLLRTIDLLSKVRRAPDTSPHPNRPPAPVPPPPETRAPSPVVPADCEKMRNEPTAVRPAANANGEPVNEAAETRQPTRVDGEHGGSETRIDGSNPMVPAREAMRRPRTSPARTPWAPSTSVRPLSIPAHRRRRTPSARPPPP